MLLFQLKQLFTARGYETMFIKEEKIRIRKKVDVWDLRFSQQYC